MKRQWIALCESSKDQIKKLRTTCISDNRVTRFEDLSNELHLEIFDYLEGFQLYKAFSNLNIRFENLLADLSIRLKVKPLWYFDDAEDHLINLINETRDRIISLNLYLMPFSITQWFSKITIDSTFSRLESLSIGEIDSNKFIPFLIGLLTLPYLRSFRIYLDDELDEVSNVYQIIFNMPMLTYSKISFSGFDISIPLPMMINEQFSRIKYLNIDHPCALNELVNILSYTPQLRRLICERLDEWDGNFFQRNLILIPNLTYISLGKCFVDFDQMETFITELSSSLEVLRLTCLRDSAYLNADRWERIISKALPQLRIFDFKYEETIDIDFDITIYHQMIHRFYSSFWINRKWSFKIYLNKDDYYDDTIIYAISPHKKTKTDDFIDQMLITIDNENVIQDEDSSKEQETISYSLKLVEQMYRDSVDLICTNYESFLFDTIGSVLTILPISCVNITRDTFFVGTLISLIKYLPNVHSLTISSLAMIYPRYLSADEIRILRLITNENRITQVNLQWMNDLAQVQFILDLCPRIKQLKFDCTNGNSPEKLLRFILIRNINHNPYLSLLIFKILSTQRDLTDLLKKLIDHEQLRQNYTITQLKDQICLQLY